MLKISVVYAVYNEEAILGRSLASVRDWADEIVVVDGTSSDNTVEIARLGGAQVVTTTNKANFHINKQMAIDKASGELILQLDADEVVDEQLRGFIQKIAASKRGKVVAWKIKRKNLFLQRFLLKGGQYPDMVIRLFYRGEAYLPAKDVHEQMEVLGKVGVAEGHLLHFANPSLESYWRKANTYTSFKAEQLREENLPVNWWTSFRYVIVKPWATFLSLYVRHRGYVDGLAGFLFAYFSALHHRLAFWKYVESLASLTAEKPRVYYPVSPVAAAQAHRGVGRYEQWLREGLAKTGAIKVLPQARGADIVHYLSFDLFRPSLRLPRQGQKLVVTIHDLIPLVLPDLYPVGGPGAVSKWGAATACPTAGFFLYLYLYMRC
jgi:glycosyltransferase involved in cell wall biosynthesis